MRRLLLPLLAFLALLLGVTMCSAVRGQVPEACRQYQRQLTAEAHTVMGLDAPIAVLAAQIQQESGCRASVSSPVGAQGLTQFMPVTAADMARKYPQELGPADAMNPRWAIKAQVLYMRDLMGMAQVRLGKAECDRWAMALSCYNGGCGWLARDQAICRAKPMDIASCWQCDPGVWFYDVANSPDRRRSPANIRENRGYPDRIMRTLTPRYVAAGYGRGVDCQSF